MHRRTWGTLVYLYHTDHPGVPGVPLYVPYWLDLQQEPENQHELGKISSADPTIGIILPDNITKLPFLLDKYSRYVLLECVKRDKINSSSGVAVTGNHVQRRSPKPTASSVMSSRLHSFVQSIPNNNSTCAHEASLSRSCTSLHPFHLHALPEQRRQKAIIRYGASLHFVNIAFASRRVVHL